MTLLEELVAMGLTADQIAEVQPVLIRVFDTGLDFDSALAALRHSFDRPPGELAKMTDELLSLTAKLKETPCPRPPSAPTAKTPGNPAIAARPAPTSQRSARRAASLRAAWPRCWGPTNKPSGGSNTRRPHPLRTGPGIARRLPSNAGTVTLRLATGPRKDDDETIRRIAISPADARMDRGSAPTGDYRLRSRRGLRGWAVRRTLRCVLLPSRHAAPPDPDSGDDLGPDARRAGRTVRRRRGLDQGPARLRPAPKSALSAPALLAGSVGLGRQPRGSQDDGRVREGLGRGPDRRDPIRSDMPSPDTNGGHRGARLPRLRPVRRPTFQALLRAAKR